jgi:hypothetical protein
MFNLLDSTNQVPLFFAREAAQVVIGVLLIHYAYILFKKKVHPARHASKIGGEIERGKTALQEVFEGMPDIRFSLIGIPTNGTGNILAGFNTCDKTFRNGILGKYLESLDVAGEMGRQSAYGQAIWAIRNPALESAVRSSASEKVGYLGKLVWYFNGLIKSDHGTPVLSTEWVDLQEEGEAIVRKWKGLFELLDESEHQDVDRKAFTDRLKKYYAEFGMSWDTDWGRAV